MYSSSAYHLGGVLITVYYLHLTSAYTISYGCWTQDGSHNISGCILYTSRYIQDVTTVDVGCCFHLNTNGKNATIADISCASSVSQTCSIDDYILIFKKPSPQASRPTTTTTTTQRTTTSWYYRRPTNTRYYRTYRRTTPYRNNRYRNRPTPRQYTTTIKPVKISKLVKGVLGIVGIVGMAMGLIGIYCCKKSSELAADQVQHQPAGPEAKSSSDGIGRAPVKEPAVFFNAHPANKTQNKATVNAGRPGYSLTSW